MRARRILLLALSATVLAVGSFLGYAWLGLPSRAQVRAQRQTNPGETSLMRQREREAQRLGRRAGRVQSWVPLARVSRHLIHAVVTAEDAKFFDHEGVDWDALKESAQKDWKQRRFVRGGSTITQQLAKNLFFTTRKSLVRKLQELVVARWLEQDLTKARILELYLNVIEWGPGVYGCQAAAQRYYRKSCAELNELEAAGLAAMIPAPRSLNPQLAPGRHAQAQRRVLWLMAQAGYLRNAALGVVPVSEPKAVAVEEEAEPAPTPTPEPTPTPTPSV